jgi:hypothetical protein
MNTLAAPTSNERDYVSSIGAFFLLDKKGKLLALRSVMVSDDCTRFAPKAMPTDLTAMYPLVSSIKPSSLMLSVAYGPSPTSQCMMQVNLGGTKKTIRAPGQIDDILSSQLEGDTFPVIALVDLEKAVHAAQESRKPLHIPLRSLQLRGSVPAELAARIKDVFMRNASGGADKTDRLQEEMLALRSAIRDTLLSEFLTKCMWLDKDSGRLGTMSNQGEALGFTVIDSDDMELRAFLVALEKDHYGDYILDFREFARVIPQISRSTPWVGPTLHVYNESYRREYGLEKHYSLYNGFRALTQHGTPVLILDGQNPLTQASEVRYMQVSHRSVNVLQGKILDGDVLNEGVRDFTTRHLVWKA